MDIVIMGPPLSGKGTHAKYLARRYGLAHVCLGDLIRACSEGEAAGLAATAAQGKYVSDEAATGLLVSRLGQADALQAVIDGYPRTIPQRLALHGHLGRIPAYIISLQIDDPHVLVGRLAHRGIVEGRPDDTLKIFENRYRSFRQLTQPVIDAYRNELPGPFADRSAPLRFAPVNGHGTVEQIQEDLSTLLDPFFRVVV